MQVTYSRSSKAWAWVSVHLHYPNPIREFDRRSLQVELVARIFALFGSPPAVLLEAARHDAHNCLDAPDSIPAGCCKQSPGLGLVTVEQAVERRDRTIAPRPATALRLLRNTRHLAEKGSIETRRYAYAYGRCPERVYGLR